MGLLLSRFHLQGENNKSNFTLTRHDSSGETATAKFLEENRNTGYNTMALNELVLTWKVNSWTFLRALQK